MTDTKTRSKPKPAAAATDRLAALAEARLAIEGVSIEIDGGRFPAKVVAGRPARDRSRHLRRRP